MENISLKIEENFLEEIEKVMKVQGYSTKTEFIREAIRDKVRKLQKQEALFKLESMRGSSKRKTTDKQLHEAREKAFNELKADN